MRVNLEDEAAAPARAPAWAVLPLRTPTLPPATTTNTTVVDGWVVDPATPFPDARAALLTAVRERGADGIVLTHHHPDHVGAATWLASELGLPIAAHARTAELLARHIQVDVALADGDRLGGTDWQVLHTPGHASGHIVLHHAETGRMIVGDMVASVGTIVIDPPDGHMATYLAQLRRLRALAPRVMVPAHGAEIGAGGAGAPTPDQVLGFYIQHREARRALVLGALAAAPADLAAITVRAYPELGPAVLPLARRSALAHLIELVEDGRAALEPSDAVGGAPRWRRA